MQQEIKIVFSLKIVKFVVDLLFIKFLQDTDYKRIYLYQKGMFALFFIYNINSAEKLI